MIIVTAPLFKLFAHVRDVEEDLCVQTFVPEFSVESLYKAVLNRVLGLDEVKFHIVEISPRIKRTTVKLATVVDLDRDRQ